MKSVLIPYHFSEVTEGTFISNLVQYGMDEPDGEIL
jgi:hypothetical protein